MPLIKSLFLKTHFEYSENAKERSSLSPQITNEVVYAFGGLYKDIFGNRLKDTNREKRFVKIRSKDTGRTLYRILRGVPTGVLSEESLYIDSDGKSLLCNENEKPELILEKTNWFRFYWSTSNIAARISFRMGWFSILLALISIAFTIILGNK